MDKGIRTKPDRSQRLDEEDSVDKAKRKYSKTPKFKHAQKKYHQSDLGKVATRKASSKYYHQTKKPETELAQQCAEFLRRNPGKTVKDFLKEVRS